MDIIRNRSNSELTFALVGRLDTTTAPSLDSAIKADLAGIEKLVLDFERLEYISSAGLRVLLAAQKAMNQQGCMIIRHVNPDITEIFQITGFSDILTVE